MQLSIEIIKKSRGQGKTTEESQLECDKLNSRYNLIKEQTTDRKSTITETRNTSEQLLSMCVGILRGKHKNIKYLLGKLAKEIKLKPSLFLDNGNRKWVSVDEFIYLNKSELYKLSRKHNEVGYILSCLDRKGTIGIKERILFVRLNEQAISILDGCEINYEKE